MRPVFVSELTNVKRFVAAASAAEDTGSPEECWALATAKPGYGKTRTCQWYGVKRDAIYVRAKAAMTPHWLLNDIVRELGGITPARSSEKLFAQAVQELATTPRTILFDEVESALRDIRVIETLRDLSDTVEVPVVLFGRETVPGALKQQPQIWRRIDGRHAEFGAVTQEDVALLFERLCEVPVSADVVARVHEESGGLVSKVRQAIKDVERLGRRGRGEVKLPALADTRWQSSRRAA